MAEAGDAGTSQRAMADMTFWNVDVSGRPSFPDPDTSREQTHTLGEKVPEADRLFPGCLYVWSSPPLFCGLLLPV